MHTRVVEEWCVRVGGGARFVMNENGENTIVRL